MTAWITRAEAGTTDVGGGPTAGVLAGRRLAVKDNVDVAGLPTTAACPSYAYTPQSSAPAVARLVAAGAVVVGKTNLDQFATGLVGTRSPYGVVANPRAPGLVSGGSSSGSAAAVAAGEADIAIGTDTAGSGRIPAAFCGIVGLKGTRGLVPTRGVVPACPSFDCTTVFASTLREAVEAAEAMAGFDPADPSSRDRSLLDPTPVTRLGVAGADVGAGCDDRTRVAYAETVARAAASGLDVRVVDLTAYLDAGAMLYGSALVAERTASVGAFLATGPPDADPSVAAIVAGGDRYSAPDLARAQMDLGQLRVRATRVWDEVDAVLLPTAPFHPSIDDVAADPIGVNAALGTFVSGCNLVDWCAAAIPVRTGGDLAGEDLAGDGLPFGVQVLGPAWHDRTIWSLAACLLDVADPVAGR